MRESEVSVRELRQNLSVYLRRVKLGETLAVTSRGERVAVLAPIAGGSRFDRLVADGRITSPQEPWTDPEPVALSGRRPGSQLTEILLADREEQDR